MVSPPDPLADSLPEKSATEPFSRHELERIREEMRTAFDHARSNLERAEALLLAARLHELARRNLELNSPRDVAR